MPLAAVVQPGQQLRARSSPNQDHASGGRRQQRMQRTEVRQMLDIPGLHAVLLGSAPQHWHTRVEVRAEYGDSAT